MGASCPNVRKLGVYKDAQRVAKELAMLLSVTRVCPWGDSPKRCDYCNSVKRAQCWIKYIAL